MMQIYIVNSGGINGQNFAFLDCGKPPTIANGFITPKTNASVHKYGDLADVKCYPAYNATLPMVACRGDGTWDAVSCVAGNLYMIKINFQ